MNIRGLNDVRGRSNNDSRNNLSVNRAQNQNLGIFESMDPLTV